MKRIVTIIILILTNLTYAQTKVELRDVTFSVPSDFQYFTEQDRKLTYDAFYQVGKISVDSINLEKFPKIQYQYYEVPGFGVDNPKDVLTRLNEIMTKDADADTLIIRESENYSLAKYAIFGTSLFEIKSLGQNGWLNIQFFDFPKDDKKNFELVKNIVTSIKHKQPYISDYDYHMGKSSEYSKRSLILLVVSLTIFIGTSYLRKKRKSSEKKI